MAESAEHPGSLARPASGRQGRCLLNIVIKKEHDHRSIIKTSGAC